MDAKGSDNDYEYDHEYGYDYDDEYDYDSDNGNEKEYDSDYGKENDKHVENDRSLKEEGAELTKEEINQFYDRSGYSFPDVQGKLRNTGKTYRSEKELSGDFDLWQEIHDSDKKRQK